MSDLAAETRNVELRLLGMTVVLPDDDGTNNTIKAIVREIGTRFPVGEQIDWLFQDAQIRAIIKAAVDTVKLGADPTPINLTQAILAAGETKAFKTLETSFIEKRIMTLVQEGRGDQAPSPALAHFVSVTLTKLSQQRRLDSAAQQVLDVVEHGEGDASRRYHEASRVWRQAAPPVAALAARSGVEMAAIHRYEMALRATATEKGLPFMQLPSVFGLNRKRGIPTRLLPGLATLITARTGFGKTTMANEIAFTNAVVGLREDYSHIQVLFFHDEDIPVMVMDRFAARVTGHTVDDLEEGYYQDEIEGAFAGCEHWLKHIYFSHCPGARIPDMIDTIRDHASRLSIHQSLLVIVDYMSHQKLNLVDMPGDNDAYRINAAYNAFKEAAEAFTREDEDSPYRGGVHVVMLSQLNDEGLPYGNKGAAFFGQLWLDIERREAEEDFDMTEIMHDAYQRVYGVPAEQQNGIFQVTRGSMAPVAQIKVVKQNLGPTPMSYVLIDPGRFLFLGPHPEAQRIWQDKCVKYRRISRD